MKKLKWILIFLAVFLIIFAASSVLTYEFVLDKDASGEEVSTDNYYAGTGAEALNGEIDENTYVTIVTPGLNDATVVRGLYTKQNITLPYTNTEDTVTENMYDESSAQDVIANDTNEPAMDKADKTDSATKKSDAENKSSATAKKEEAVEEKPKAENVKTEPAKTDVKKAEAENKENTASETKNEPIKEEQNVQTPQEPVKNEEPVQIKPQLDPNKQYSDTGI